MTEVTSPGGEGQGMSRPSEEIIRYPHKRSSTPLYKEFAAKGQAREAVSYFLNSFLSNLRDWKKCHEARFTSFYLCTSSI